MLNPFSKLWHWRKKPIRVFHVRLLYHPWVFYCISKALNSLLKWIKTLLHLRKELLTWHTQWRTFDDTGEAQPVHLQRLKASRSFSCSLLLLLHLSFKWKHSKCKRYSSVSLLMSCTQASLPITHRLALDQPWVRKCSTRVVIAGPQTAC